MVLPLCLQRSEGDGTCLPPVGWNLDDCQGPECWLEGHAPLGLPYSAAWHHIVTFCKFWEWLAVIFRIQRSSSDGHWRHSCKYNKKRCRSPIMLKPVMRSHCKAMCYRKLANCFGRVTAIGDIHVWEWLPVIFRIRRSSSIMLKPMMRSHCKAMCYTRLASCFGLVTAGVDIHAASNVLAMVLPLCLQRSEGDGTCLPPVGWNLDDCQGPECWLEGHAPLGLRYCAAWHCASFGSG